jgi:hypothetical protein
MSFTLGTDPPVTYPSVGRCIYCPDEGASRLGDEHIIPFALNGTQVLPQASCRECEGVTSYLDGLVARSIFYELRASAGMRTRSELPATFPVVLVFEDGHEEEVMVPADMHPATLVLPHFTLPDALSGKQSDGKLRFTYTAWMRENVPAFDEFKQSRGAKFAKTNAWIKPQQFSRWLAKIAHAYAVARLGLGGFEPTLLDLIHGRNLAIGPELVGSDPETPPPASSVLHQLDLLQHARFVVVRIRLFASSSIDGAHPLPVYLVVAGTVGSAR